MSYPPSPAQSSFINDLLAKRDVPEDMADTVRALMSQAEATSRQASGIIDTLKGFPYKVRMTTATTGPTPFQAFLAAFEGVEDAKYAIPVDYLRTAFPEFNLTGDLVFFEVKTYKGKRYLNKLQGAPGDFVRSRVSLDAGTRLLRFIKGRHVEFAKLFAAHYSVCGRCASPLTDQTSRETGVGPECRKVWGL